MTGSRKILMFLHAYYKEDNRPRREAEALAADGWDVEVICLNKGGELTNERFEGVNILRADMARSTEKTVGKLAWEYVRFFFACLRLRGRAMLRKEYAVVMAHNMPNFLVFAALPAKLRGTPVILDIHDSMLGVFENTLSKPGMKSKLLTGVLNLEERLSMAFANARMTVTAKFAEALKARSGEQSFFLLHNAPDASRLNVGRNPCFKSETRLLHHGNIHERNGIQLMFAPLLRVNQAGRRFVLEIQGHGPYWDTLKQTANEMDLSEGVEFGGPFDYSDIVPRLSVAHAGIVIPVGSNQMHQALHVKFLEYAACKVPIIARRLNTLEHYFPDDCAFYVETEEDIVKALETLRADPAQAKERAERAYNKLQEISWETERPKFLEFINRISKEKAVKVHG